MKEPLKYYSRQFKGANSIDRKMDAVGNCSCDMPNMCVGCAKNTTEEELKHLFISTHYNEDYSRKTYDEINRDYTEIIKEARDV